MKKAVSAVLAVLITAAVVLAAAGCGPAKSKKTAVIPKATDAPTAPTLAPNYGRYHQNSTTVPSTDATQGVTGISEADLEAVTATAFAYYGTSEEYGSTVNISSIETAPGGTQFYFLYVCTTDGNNYPLYVSFDASIAYEPETFYAVYGISPRVYVEGDGSDGAGDGGDGAGDGGDGGYDNGGYDNGGYDYDYDSVYGY